MTAAGAALVQRAVGARHGIVHAARPLPTSRCDIAGVHHAAVADGPLAAGGWSPAGGAAWTPEAALDAAVGEAVERWAAATCPLPPPQPGDRAPALPIDRWTLHSPAQRGDRRFPYRAAYDDPPLTAAWSLADNARWLVPRALVGLGDPAGAGIGTSSGLAAAPSVEEALLRATQEVVERDALMTVWNHGLAGRRVALGPAHAGPVAALGGRVEAVDATPAHSPHPVALVAGWVARRGRRRVALGAACRATWAEAVDKAFLEFAQGVLFDGAWLAANPGRRLRPAEVVAFEDHAAYYTAHPERWEVVPLLAGGPAGPPPADGPAGLGALVGGLRAAGVRLWYRDLTGPDAAQLGLSVVRVLSPDLVPIHADHRWPFLGGRSGDVAWRYPGVPAGPWPSEHPHPLG